jgi:hypothetical protein
MRTDLAALTPPLVMAAAFIAGVVVLLRREMAPRRSMKISQAEDSDALNDPHGEMAPPVLTQTEAGRQNGGEPASGDNSANNHAPGSEMRDLPGHGDDGGIRHAEDQPPAPPKV